MLRVCFGALALCAAALAQQFEVASVKPSAPADGGSMAALKAMAMAQDGMYNGHAPGWLPAGKGRISLKGRPLAGLIASAYRVRQRDVSGPPWMEEARFDIEATYPAGTPQTALADMLRALLEERFGLKVRREDKEESGYALVEAKGGAKLAPAVETKSGEAMDAQTRRENMEKMRADTMKRMEEMKRLAADNGGRFSFSNWKQDSGTLQELGDWIAGRLGKPVANGTGLDGKYLFQIEVVRMGEDTEEYGVTQALAKLGLKLEPRKITVSTVVVDHVERTPTAN